MPADAPDLEQRIRDALDTVIDPCSEAAGCAAGLDAMGLIRELAIRPGAEGAAVRIRIGVTDPGCLMGAVFLTRARHALAAVPGIATLDLALSHRIDWTPADHRPDYARRLADHRQRRFA